MKFIFVGGCGRSGTSLVQKLLVSHSKIIGGPEFDHTKDIFQVYKNMVSDFSLERQSFFYSKEMVDKNFRNFYQGFFQELLLKNKDAIYISEKTPINIDVIEDLLEVIPESKFINVVRDGRDVVLSHFNVKKRSKNKGIKIDRKKWTTSAISMLWNRSINSYFNAIKKSDFQARIFTVKFEDLVKKPQKVLLELFSFLNLSFEDKILFPEQINPQETGAIIDGIWYTEEMYIQKFNAQRIGKWETELNLQDKITANIFMSNNLSKLGYEVNQFALKLNQLLYFV